MYSSKEFEASSEQWIEETLNPHFGLLKHLTVRLHGPSATRGRQSGNFTGTGVIVRVEDDVTHVLTAKHNLYVAGKPQGAYDEQVAHFTSKIKVEFTALDGTARDAAIGQVDLPDGNTTNSGYDVAVLRVRDAALAGAVRDLAGPDTSRRPFTSADWQGNGPSILELPDRERARQVLASGKLYRGPVQDQYVNHGLLQFGHGRTTPKGDQYALRHRALRIDKLTQAGYIDRTKDGSEDAFVFHTTDQDTSTAEGDSGGPVYAIHPSGTPSFLIGLTMGANFYVDHVARDDAPTDNNAFAVVSSDRVNRFA